MTTSSGETSENLTAYRFRWLGYGFLVYALIDTIHVLLTVQPGQPGWLLQTIGQFVERVAMPLLGFTLIFFGEYYGRKDAEKLGLKLLSWLCLVLAIAFLLMTPSVIFQSFGLRSQVDQQISTTAQQRNQAIEQRLVQLKQVEDQLNKSTPAQITSLASQLSASGISVDPSQPEAVKSQIQAKFKAARAQIEDQKRQTLARVQQEASTQLANVFKNAVKWGLGALVSAFLFFYLWKSSRWAR